MLITFGLPISVRFFSDPWFILQYLSSVFHHWLDPFVAMDSVRAVQKFGGGGSHRWWKIFCGCAREIIMACNLLRQAEAQCQVLVRLPVLQGTGEVNSANNFIWRPCDRDCDTSINPSTHMKNGFIYFLCHELAQICKYNPGLLS